MPTVVPKISPAVITADDSKSRCTLLLSLYSDSKLPQVRDAGNCSPRHMRCTLNAVPGAWDLLKQSCIPFAVVVQPLAEAKPGDDLVQVHPGCL